MNGFIRSEHQAPPEVQCYGKIAYPSRRAAKASIRRHRDRKGLNAYRCPHCSIETVPAWHIGHRPVKP